MGKKPLLSDAPCAAQPATPERLLPDELAETPITSEKTPIDTSAVPEETTVISSVIPAKEPIGVTSKSEDISAEESIPPEKNPESILAKESTTDQPPIPPIPPATTRPSTTPPSLTAALLAALDEDENKEVWVVASPEVETPSPPVSSTPDKMAPPPLPPLSATHERSRLIPPLTQTLFTELLDQRVAMAMKVEAEKDPASQQLQQLQTRVETVEARLSSQLQRMDQHVSRRLETLEHAAQGSTETEIRSSHIQFREVVYREDRRDHQRNLLEMFLVTVGVVLVSGFLIVLPYEFFAHIKWSKFLLLIPLLLTGTGIAAQEILNHRRQILEDRIATRERLTGLPTLALSPNPTILMFLRTTLWCLAVLEILLLLLSDIA